MRFVQVVSSTNEFTVNKTTRVRQFACVNEFARAIRTRDKNPTLLPKYSVYTLYLYKRKKTHL